MFYENAIGAKLRFGDVLKGYLSTTPNFAKPFSEKARDPYKIDVWMPDFCVVIDPCCHIGGGTLSLTPLKHVKTTFWDTPFLLEDMTRINRKGMPKDLMHPELWNKKPDTEKTAALNAVPDYGHKRYFVYEKDNCLYEYPVARDSRYEETVDPVSKLPKYNEIQGRYTFTTRQYMIDFKNAYHVNCGKVSEPEKTIDESVLSSIVLQLSVKTRTELRDKMADYFGKPPDEDKVDL